MPGPTYHFFHHSNSSSEDCRNLKTSRSSTIWNIANHDKWINLCNKKEKEEEEEGKEDEGRGRRGEGRRRIKKVRGMKLKD